MRSAAGARCGSTPRSTRPTSRARRSSRSRRSRMSRVRRFRFVQGVAGGARGRVHPGVSGPELRDRAVSAGAGAGDVDDTQRDVAQRRGRGDQRGERDLDPVAGGHDVYGRAARRRDRHQVIHMNNTQIDRDVVRGAGAGGVCRVGARDRSRRGRGWQRGLRPRRRRAGYGCRGWRRRHRRRGRVGLAGGGGIGRHGTGTAGTGGTAGGSAGRGGAGGQRRRRGGSRRAGAARRIGRCGRRRRGTWRRGRCRRRAPRARRRGGRDRQRRHRRRLAVHGRALPAVRRLRRHNGRQHPAVGWSRQGNATVADDQAARGAHALKLTPAADKRLRLLQLRQLRGFGAAHWGRIFYRVQTPPPDAFVHASMAAYQGDGPGDRPVDLPCRRHREDGGADVDAPVPLQRPDHRRSEFGKGRPVQLELRRQLALRRVVRRRRQPGLPVLLRRRGDDADAAGRTAPATTAAATTARTSR